MLGKQLLYPLHTNAAVRLFHQKRRNCFEGYLRLEKVLIIFSLVLETGTLLLAHKVSFLRNPNDCLRILINLSQFRWTVKDRKPFSFLTEPRWSRVQDFLYFFQHILVNLILTSSQSTKDVRVPLLPPLRERNWALRWSTRTLSYEGSCALVYISFAYVSPIITAV